MHLYTFVSKKLKLIANIQMNMYANRLSRLHLTPECDTVSRK